MIWLKTISFASLALCWGMVHADTFNSGSNGSFGAITMESGTTTIDLPPDGIIHATTITLGSEQGFFTTLKFKQNALNTPVYLLATGDIIIKSFATISVNGENGDSVTGGAGGPGGFNGGEPGKLGSQPGAGFGPGAGLGGSQTNDDNGAGIGGYGTAGGTNAKDGQIYGSQLLIPMLGGSGGGGTDTTGGGGGGGGIVLASNTRIHIDAGAINAIGGFGSGSSKNGSGGAIRLIAPIVSGNGFIRVHQQHESISQGAGRIRIDTIDQTEFNLNPRPSGAPVTLGNFMKVFPDITPRLNIIEAAGETIPEGSSTGVTINLPSEASVTQSITVQAHDFSGITPIRVVITPDTGEPISIDAEIDMGADNPATVTVMVDLPQNVPLHVNAWTR